jgi:hypothetical protein
MTTTTVDSTTPGPESLLQMGRGYWAAKALLSAVELEIFPLLAKQPSTEPQIREQLKLNPRSTRDFLDALVGLGLLTRDGQTYHNSEIADLYLDPRKPTYFGGRLKMLSWQYSVWGNLANLLRTGEKQSGAGDFSQLYARPEAVRGFMLAMDGANAGIGTAIAREFDWSKRKSFIDIGGARGNLSAEIVKARPHLSGGTFDLPEVEPFFTEHMTNLGLAGKVRYYSGDFFTEDLPTADVHIFGHVLHDWDDEKRIALLTKAYKALPAGGAALVYDAMVDDERQSPMNLLMSLSMQLITPGGSEYMASDCQAWLRAAGFERTSVHQLTASDKLVVGYKA